MRILHGMTNVAGQGTFAVKGLKELGQDAKLVLWRSNKYGYDYDLCLKIGHNKLLYPIYGVIMSFYGIYAMFHYDMFHFHYGYSALPYNYDLPIIKALNKKVFMEFHGSDIRWILNRDKGQGFINTELPPVASNKIQNRLKYILDKVDHVIIHDYELEKYVVGHRDKIIYVPLRVDVNRFTPHYPSIDNKVPIIVHAPTNPEIKGTKYVIDAINELKRDYNFEFKLVQNMTQEEAFRVYETADIIVDQLCIGTYGVFAIEAMAMGKPVISFITDEMKKQFPQELPIVNASIYNIRDQLEHLLKNPEVRNEVGIQSRKYAENYHDYRYVARYLNKVYSGKIGHNSQSEAFREVRNIKENEEKINL